MILVLVALAVVVGVAVLALALGAAAGWGDKQEAAASPLAFLGSLRSKSGKPFFASRRHVGELAAEVEGLKEGLAANASPPEADSLAGSGEGHVVDP